jgi:hypothetical protein
VVLNLVHRMAAVSVLHAASSPTGGPFSQLKLTG